jgi:hypothetical protein
MKSLILRFSDFCNEFLFNTVRSEVYDIFVNFSFFSSEERQNFNPEMQTHRHVIYFLNGEILVSR